MRQLLYHSNNNNLLFRENENKTVARRRGNVSIFMPSRSTPCSPMYWKATSCSRLDKFLWRSRISGLCYIFRCLPVKCHVIPTRKGQSLVFLLVTNFDSKIQKMTLEKFTSANSQVFIRTYHYVTRTTKILWKKAR